MNDYASMESITIENKSLNKIPTKNLDRKKIQKILDNAESVSLEEQKEIERSLDSMSESDKEIVLIRKIKI